MIEVKPRRVGGATYQVPVQIEGDRGAVAGDALAADVGARARQVDAREAGGRAARCRFNGTGATIKRREDTHRMAEANRAFAHYRY